MNAYIEPEDFQGLGQLGWCPVIYGKEQLGCQEPTIKQLLAMTSGLLPIDNLGCGTPNSTWTADDWFWQYRCALLLNRSTLQHRSVSLPATQHLCTASECRGYLHIAVMGGETGWIKLVIF